MTVWSNRYIGIPRVQAGRSRAGVDCYGLLWLVYREVLGLDLASYAGETADAPERAEIARLVESGRSASPWREVSPGAEREFDMAVFRRGGVADHVGLVLAPGCMLHVVDETGVYRETFSSGRWRGRLVALHRHEALA
ncbi:putative lipoprotein NlpC [Bradyrhizobium elkanii]|uniref:NlpC/P60 family protein n=1 Tax=Bradyrhizobium elkanii TaxID=29448 RepID=UPI0010214C4C|nr:NlpC/P60 family protein [Bradyrhizobium elkanii]NWL40350.1 NlpC/P60 family protein [Bradyrhizobium elkanii]RYM21094.1 hypothetical protein EWH13_28180 [Bradyrhizobium elkanii]